MSKKPDWNDKSIADKEKAKQDFEESEANSNITDFLKILEDKHPEEGILRRLNSQHIYINSIAGATKISAMVYNEVVKREIMEFWPVETFLNKYSDKVAPGGNKVTLGQWWIKNDRKTKAESVVFEPNKESGIIEIGDKDYLNLWEGFGIEAKQGSWQKTKRHIYKILCNSKSDRFKYVIRWLAWTVQNPDERAEVAIVFKGEKGAGKSFLFAQVKKIFGRHGMVISDRSRLTGKFTGHFRQLSFLFCDEVYYPGDKEVEGRIKSIITEEYLDVEGKHKDAVTIKNRLHIAMCTNNEWVIPATKDERRYYIDKVSNKYAQNSGKISDTKREKYFKSLWGEMENGGREAMLYDLLNMELDEWHPRQRIPNTEEMTVQKEKSAPLAHKYALELLDDGHLPSDCEKREIAGEYWYCVPTPSLHEYMQRLSPDAKISKKSGGTALIAFGGDNKVYRMSSKKYMALPELGVMRENWDQMYGERNWDDQKNWAIIPSSI